MESRAKKKLATIETIDMMESWKKCGEMIAACQSVARGTKLDWNQPSKAASFEESLSPHPGNDGDSLRQTQC